jgi:hypothetical protein
VDETKSEPPKIKVVDRRKFTPAGDPVETPATTAKAAAPAKPAEDPVAKAEVQIPNPAPEAAGPSHRGQTSQLFLELVTMLAGQAELLLVGAEDLPAQPAEAKRMIDYLGVLEEKTAAHVSDDEAKLLSSVLYQLRTFYLQRK